MVPSPPSLLQLCVGLSAYGVSPALARAGILQLDGGHRQPVHCQNHVERAIACLPRSAWRRQVAGMTRHLARHRQPVLAEQLQHLVVRTVRGLEIGEAKRLAVKLEPMPLGCRRAGRGRRV